MEYYGLTLGHVVIALKSQNVSIPGGRIDVGREEYLLRTVGQFGSVDEMRDVIISSTPDGAFIRLSDIAEVSDTFEKRTTTSRFNDQKSMTITMSKKPSGNTIALIEQIKQTCEYYQKKLNGSRLN